MNERDIAVALQQRLAMQEIAPLAFENHNAAPARPFIFVQHVPTVATARDVAGGSLERQGYMAATIVVPEGEFATGAMGIAIAIELLFPVGLRLTIDGGVVTIPRPVQQRTGFQDGQDYRLPVQVYYEARA